jgi:hypothetical protein
MIATSFRSSAWVVGLVCAAVGCGGSIVDPGGSKGSGGSAGSSPDSGPTVPCVTSSDCASGSTCFYPMGDCSAQGQCFGPADSGAAMCNLIAIVCGCGTNQTTGCGFPDGYASGPALSGASCVGGTSPVPEAGTHRGPCAVSGDCPSGSSCYYPIGSCDAKGECIEDPAPGSPMCKSIEALCGCGGGMVTTGCGFPDGYASGPSNGSSFCGDDGGATFPDASGRR